jgi:hypothetical protein
MMDCKGFLMLVWDTHESAQDRELVLQRLIDERISSLKQAGYHQIKVEIKSPAMENGQPDQAVVFLAQR